MRKGLWHKRIPTIAALALLFLSIWVTTFLIQTGVIFVGRASPNKIPQNVSISNITENSFTVTYTTNEKTLSGISVEEGNVPSFVVFDDRNKEISERKEFYSHFISVTDLKPNTTYEFSILSDGEAYLDGDEKYKVTTTSPVTIIPLEQNPIIGTILLPDGNKGVDTIVELEIEGAQKFSTLTNDEGEYIISISGLRKASLDDYFYLLPSQEIIINALRQNAKTSVKLLFAEAGLIPVITLEKQYDFTNIKTSEVSTSSSALRIPTPQIVAGEVRITTPRENQSFVDSAPLFRGTALPNKIVKITIEPSLFENVNSESSGIWSFRPDEDLAPGLHTITIESPDKYGIIKSVSQSFTVFSSGSQVAQSATPSATPTLTTTPTKIPTQTPTQVPTPTVVLSPTVSQIPSPTLSPTPIPTANPTPIVTETITPTPTITAIITPPPPGNNSSIILTFVSALLIFAGGALLFLL